MRRLARVSLARSPVRRRLGTRSQAALAARALAHIVVAAERKRPSGLDLVKPRSRPPASQHQQAVVAIMFDPRTGRHPARFPRTPGRAGRTDSPHHRERTGPVRARRSRECAAFAIEFQRSPSTKRGCQNGGAPVQPYRREDEKQQNRAGQGDVEGSPCPSATRPSRGPMPATASNSTPHHQGLLIIRRIKCPPMGPA